VARAEGRVSEGIHNVLGEAQRAQALAFEADSRAEARTALAGDVLAEQIGELRRMNVELLEKEHQVSQRVGYLELAMKITSDDMAQAAKLISELRAAASEARDAISNAAKKPELREAVARVEKTLVRLQGTEAEAGNCLRTLANDTSRLRVSVDRRATTDDVAHLRREMDQQQHQQQQLHQSLRDELASTLRKELREMKADLASTTKRETREMLQEQLKQMALKMHKPTEQMAPEAVAVDTGVASRTRSRTNQASCGRSPQEAPRHEVVVTSDDDDTEESVVVEDPVSRLADILQRGGGKAKEREEKEFPFVLETFAPFFESQHSVFSLVTTLSHAFGVSKSGWRAKEFGLLEQWLREAAELVWNGVDLFEMKEFCRRGRKLLWSVRAVVATEEEGREYNDLMKRFDLSTNGADFVSHKLKVKVVRRGGGRPFPRGGHSFANGSRGGFQGRFPYPQRGEPRGRS
jgi:hypothetical protein